MSRWSGIVASTLVWLVLAPFAAQAEGAVRFAVLGVEGRGVVDDQAVEGLSAMLATEIARRPDVDVIRGAEIGALLGFEAERQLLGCAPEDAGCLAEIGGALGVDFLVQSEVSRVGQRWLLSLVLLDPDRGRAVARLTRATDRAEGLVDLAPSAVSELLQALPGLQPAPRAGLGAPTLRWVALGTGAVVAGAGGVLLGTSWATWLTYDRDPRTVDLQARRDAEFLAPVGVGLLLAGATLVTAGLVVPWGGGQVAVLPRRDGVLVAFTFAPESSR